MTSLWPMLGHIWLTCLLGQHLCLAICDGWQNLSMYECIIQTCITAKSKYVLPQHPNMYYRQIQICITAKSKCVLPHNPKGSKGSKGLKDLKGLKGLKCLRLFRGKPGNPNFYHPGLEARESAGSDRILLATLPHSCGIAPYRGCLQQKRILYKHPLDGSKWKHRFSWTNGLCIVKQVQNK